MVHFYLQKLISIGSVPNLWINISLAIKDLYRNKIIRGVTNVVHQHFAENITSSFFSSIVERYETGSDKLCSYKCHWKSSMLFFFFIIIIMKVFHV